MTGRLIRTAAGGFATLALLVAMPALGHAQVPTPQIPPPLPDPNCVAGCSQEGPISDAIAFAGTATITDGDGDNAVDLLGDTGNFTYSTAACAGVSFGDLNGGVNLSGGEGIIPEAGTCSFTVNGSFNNVVCGTGSATGNGAFTSGPDGAATISLFTIDFYGTVGFVEVTADGESGIGVVDLGPSAQGGVPSLEGGIPPSNVNCTSAFTASGAVATWENTSS